MHSSPVKSRKGNKHGNERELPVRHPFDVASQQAALREFNRLMRIHR